MWTRGRGSPGEEYDQIRSAETRQLAGIRRRRVGRRATGGATQSGRRSGAREAAEGVGNVEERSRLAPGWKMVKLDAKKRNNQPRFGVERRDGGRRIGRWRRCVDRGRRRRKKEAEMADRIISTWSTWSGVRGVSSAHHTTCARGGGDM